MESTSENADHAVLEEAVGRLTLQEDEIQRDEAAQYLQYEELCTTCQQNWGAKAYEKIGANLEAPSTCGLCKTIMHIRSFGSESPILETKVDINAVAEGGMKRKDPAKFVGANYDRKYKQSS